jgi:hypothetical protein
MFSMGWRELVVLLWRRRELIVPRGAMAHGMSKWVARECKNTARIVTPL